MWPDSWGSCTPQTSGSGFSYSEMNSDGPECSGFPVPEIVIEAWGMRCADGLRLGRMWGPEASLPKEIWAVVSGERGMEAEQQTPLML